jgi:hypothetical protein
MIELNVFGIRRKKEREEMKTRRRARETRERERERRRESSKVQNGCGEVLAKLPIFPYTHGVCTGNLTFPIYFISQLYSILLSFSFSFYPIYTIYI